MSIHTPNLAFVKYTGEAPRKLWEARARKVPTLEKGDVVLLPAVTAVLMQKKYGFEKFDNEELFFAGENNQEDVNNSLNIKLPEGMKEEEKEKFEKTVLEFLEDYSNSLNAPTYNISDEELLEAILSALEDGDFKREELSEYDLRLLEAHEKVQEIEESEDIKIIDDGVSGDGLDESQSIKEYILPTKKDLDILDEEQIKFACKHVGIKIGNKRIDTLKGLLLGYLPE